MSEAPERICTARRIGGERVILKPGETMSMGYVDSARYVRADLAPAWQPIASAFSAGVMTPYPGKRVLLFAPPYGAGSGHWDGTKWQIHFCLSADASPTHWMPLPAPPEVGE
jgi:hypothetical protein